MAEIDDYAKFLSDAATAEIAVVHEFRILYAQDDRSFHAFVEGGEDRLFYLPEVRRRLERTRVLHCHVCNGKPKLSAIRAELHRLEFDTARYVFFADRDYDDFLGTQIETDDRTYITDYYSIESEFSSHEAVELLLTDFGGMSKADPNYKKITEGYLLGFNEFAQRIRPLSAWILSMRERGSRPNLNNSSMANVFEITSLGRIKRRKGSFEAFRKSVGLEHEESACLPTLKWVRKLRPADSKKWIRGKYEAWFFRTYLLVLATKLFSKSTSKWKVPSPLREDRICEALGGRLPIPSSLEVFLDRTCCV